MRGETKKRGKQSDRERGRSKRTGSRRSNTGRKTKKEKEKGGG